MTKSRAEELNPLHRCAECGVEHFYIEPMKMPMRNLAGQVVDVPLIPLEIVLVADGPITFTTDQEPRISSQVPVVGMLWGVPGSNNPSGKTVMVLN